MKIGCFALVEPFRSMSAQFAAIKALGISCADLTDNHQGGMLGVEYGFSASISLDSHPAKIRAMAAASGIELTAFCAHANLLDPPSPDVYGTNEIIKAIRLAALLGISDVITTEGDPKTEYGEVLDRREQIFAMVEKLRAPVQWAAEVGVKLLLEPHGRVTDTIDGMSEVLEKLGHPETVGICLDTGNSWLGGTEPLEFVRTFGSRIGHVHWKDLPAEMESQRGTVYGCGMGMIALGDGVVGIPAVVQALKQAGFDGATTLEIFGADAVKTSAQRLQTWWAGA
jgi:inosose dehydratase